MDRAQQLVALLPCQSLLRTPRTEIIERKSARTACASVILMPFDVLLCRWLGRVIKMLEIEDTSVRWAGLSLLQQTIEDANHATLKSQHNAWVNSLLRVMKVSHRSFCFSHFYAFSSCSFRVRILVLLLLRHREVLAAARCICRRRRFGCGRLRPRAIACTRCSNARCHLPMCAETWW